MTAYAQHVIEVEAACMRALACGREAGEPFDAIVFHAGSPAAYHADDLAVPFRGHAHFLRFGWVEGPGHAIVFQPGERTKLIRNVASDFWYAAPAPLDPALGEAFEVVETHDVLAETREHLGRSGEVRCAFIGANAGFAGALGCAPEAQNPASLIAALDWERGYKTEYEIDCLREATRLAALGHRAVAEGVIERASEFELHLAYLAASQQTDDALPYPNIIAWDEAAAVLHYERRRTSAPEPAAVLLIDAGARHCGYASDITRTHATGRGASADFHALLSGMEALQARLVEGVAPGVDFVALHRRAEQEIAALLREVGVLRVDVEQARAEGLLFAFFPHGLGHPLGLQTHDVGGHQADARGSVKPPPADCPHLRNTRVLEAGNVVTIEPGLYFIPSLLEPLRGNPGIDWNLVDALLPHGGIRIEDDVLVSEAGRANLTRPFLP